MKKIIKKSILSSLILSIACIIMVSPINDIVASFLFSFGFSTIILKDYFAYTGKIAYYREQGNNIFEIVINLSIILLINCITIYIICYIYGYYNIHIQELAKIYFISKISNPVTLSFINAIACGMMLFLAVDSYNKTENFLMVIMPIMIFTLAGFEQSIANVGYLALSHIFDLEIFLYIFVWIIGNSIGSIILVELEK